MGITVWSQGIGFVILARADTTEVINVIELLSIKTGSYSDFVDFLVYSPDIPTTMILFSIKTFAIIISNYLAGSSLSKSDNTNGKCHINASF